MSEWGGGGILGRERGLVRAWRRRAKPVELLFIFLQFVLVIDDGVVDIKRETLIKRAV